MISAKGTTVNTNLAAKQTGIIPAGAALALRYFENLDLVGNAAE